MSAWDITSAVFDATNFFDYSADSTDSTTIAFTDSGSTLLILFNTFAAPVIRKYSLGQTWKVNTASYQSVHPVSGGENIAVSGPKVYVVNAGDVIYQYSLPTLSYDGLFKSVSAQDTGMIGLCFSSDGANLYTVGVTNGRIYHYTLVAGDISTAVYTGEFLSINAQDGLARGIVLKEDGTRLYVYGQSNDTIYEYTLPSAFSLSGATYSGVSYGADLPAGGQGLAFSTGGGTFFVSDSNWNTVYAWNMSPPVPAPFWTNYIKCFEV